MTIDPVTLEILKNHCRAAAESMAFTLYRTAHSTFVKETEDFTTGLTTPEGLTFATPVELGATWFVGLNYANVIKAVEHYDEGDIAMTNDPYSGSVCTHSPDMHIWKPVFHDGEIVCYVVGHIHNTDVGGAVPASISRTSAISFGACEGSPAKVVLAKPSQGGDASTPIGRCFRTSRRRRSRSRASESTKNSLPKRTLY